MQISGAVVAMQSPGHGELLSWVPVVECDEDTVTRSVIPTRRKSRQWGSLLGGEGKLESYLLVIARLMVYGFSLRRE